MPPGIQGSNKAPPPMSVTGQPVDCAPAVVHVLHFHFHYARLEINKLLTKNHPSFVLFATTFQVCLTATRTAMTTCYPYDICKRDCMSTCQSSYMFACTILTMPCTRSLWKWFVCDRLGRSFLGSFKAEEQQVHRFVPPWVISPGRSASVCGATG